MPVSFKGEGRRAALFFAHITLGFALVVWGLDAASVWRVGLGAYLLFLVGWEPLFTIGRFGLYLVDDVAKMTAERLRGDE